MLRTLILAVALIGLAVAGFSEAAVQEVPNWIQLQESEPPPAPPPPPTGGGELPDLPGTPIDGGIVWLALAGGGYAAYRLRRAQRDA